MFATQKKEGMEQKPRRNNFRAILNMCIGAAYIIIGGVVAYKKAFGALDLSPATSYGLGAILLLYGIFRVWRGYKDTMPVAE